MVYFRKYSIGTRVKCADDPAKIEHDFAKLQRGEMGKGRGGTGGKC